MKNNLSWIVLLLLLSGCYYNPKIYRGDGEIDSFPTWLNVHAYELWLPPFDITESDTYRFEIIGAPPADIHYTVVVYPSEQLTGEESKQFTKLLKTLQTNLSIEIEEAGESTVSHISDPLKNWNLGVGVDSGNVAHSGWNYHQRDKTLKPAKFRTTNKYIVLVSITNVDTRIEHRAVTGRIRFSSYGGVELP